MSYKYIWIPPAHKSECEIVDRLSLQNIYFFKEYDFLHLKENKVELRGIFLASSGDDLHYYKTHLDLNDFSEFNLLTLPSFLTEATQFKNEYLNNIRVNIFCLFDEDCKLGEFQDIRYFTNDINLYFSHSNVQFFWPDLSYSESKLLALSKYESYRKLEILPIPIYNPDANSQTNFNSIGEVLYARRNLKADLSIIIPHYDNRYNLEFTIINLAEQIKFSKYQIEIIIVDDGTQAFEISSLLTLSEDLNLLILKMPRYVPRTMGDQSYRAGIARNFGVEYSLSEKILFLDCDMLIQEDLISKVIVSLDQYDLLLPQRYQLKPGVKKKYSKLDLETDIDFSATPYWVDFYKNTTDWNQVHNKWKYVSTYCLGITKKNFYRIGPFSNSFVRYGCEDVDLGFRAYLLGLKFQLLTNHVYHLQPLKSRSEFEFDVVQRKNLLWRSYYIFYRLHYDIDIFDDLISPVLNWIRSNEG